MTTTRPDFLERCYRLRHLGIHPGLVSEIRDAEDERILTTVEGLSPDDVDDLNRTWRRSEGAMHQLAAAAARPTRCVRLCCPAVVAHDRTHPLCVVRPRLWQDDGDQA